jgi:hypothetical protein
LRESDPHPDASQISGKTLENLCHQNLKKREFCLLNPRFQSSKCVSKFEEI